MKKRWVYNNHDRARTARFAAELGVSPLLSAILIARGHDTEEKALAFLAPLGCVLHDPYKLKDMDVAVDRVLRAVENREKILIWGDYDVDGTTGTVVLRKALEILGGETGYHIPHRFREGYGLNIEKLEEAKAKGYSLVISVDTGSRAFEAAEWARSNGIDLIITDHHLADEAKGNPCGLAVVNPNQAGCSYPDKHLAGVGVAFKLAHALLATKGRERLVNGFLKVVAIGTIADIMQLTGENRSIVARGLADLPAAKNHGLRALMEVADCSSEMSSYDIGFRIAPRINAAGRMDEGLAIIRLFEASTFESARALAEALNSRNKERQKVQGQICDLALREYIENGGSENQQYVAVIAGEAWHRGVIGLASSRITERLNRPSLVISLENGIGHGSARSIKNFHLLDALDSCADLLEKHGGHAAACGFTIKRENIGLLRERLNLHAAETLAPEDLTPELTIDARVSSASLNLHLVRELKKLEPFGAGNPKPVFATSGLFLNREPLVMKEKHLKLELADENNRKFEAVWWGGVEKAAGLKLNRYAGIQVAYSPEINRWNNSERLQLVVEDLNLV
jgi:single-stranded-DNA-specific exonuclease